MNKLYGIIFCLIMAIPAYFLGKAFPIVGGPVFGILIGMIFAFFARPAILENGIKFTGKKILQWSIILLGFEMNLYVVMKVGADSLSIMFFTLAASFITAYVMGKVLKLEGNVPILIGVGTSICGGSAIAATAPVIKANDKDIAFSISTIFLFNVIAVFIFPALGHFMGMNDQAFGMWAGTAINDTSSVVAAAFSYSDPAGSYATIVKLTRTLLIVPVTLVLAFYTARKEKFKAGSTFSFSRVFPWFVLGFVAASIMVTFGLVSADAGKSLGQVGKFMIIMAMVAIGLNTNVIKLIKNGIRPIFLGLCCWFAVAVVSLFFIL